MHLNLRKFRGATSSMHLTLWVVLGIVIALAGCHATNEPTTVSGGAHIPDSTSAKFSMDSGKILYAIAATGAEGEFEAVGTILAPTANNGFHQVTTQTDDSVASISWPTPTITGFPATCVVGQSGTPTFQINSAGIQVSARYVFMLSCETQASSLLTALGRAVVTNPAGETQSKSATVEANVVGKGCGGPVDLPTNRCGNIPNDPT